MGEELGWDCKSAMKGRYDQPRTVILIQPEEEGTVGKQSTVERIHDLR
jgi:hypothetical protein